jgi:hypothetical protein
MTRALPSLLFAALALAGCMAGSGPGPESHADAATMAACRQRADQIYNQQNRGDIYRQPDAINSPSSGSYAPGVSDRGLSELYAHDRAINDCVRNTGTGAERSESDNAAPPPPARP